MASVIGFPRKALPFEKKSVSLWVFPYLPLSYLKLKGVECAIVYRGQTTSAWQGNISDMELFSL